MTRVLSAVVALPPLILLIRLGPSLYFSILIAAAAALGAWEFFRIAQAPGKPAAWILGSALAAGLAFGGQLEPQLLPVMIVWAALLLFFSSVFWLPTGAWPAPRGWTGGAVGILFVGATFGSLALLRNFGGESEGWRWVFFLLLVVWGGDTGAYYGGRALGKRPLSPVLSPQKTIEGTVVGLAAGVAGGLLARAWFLPPETPVWETGWISLLLGVAGFLGDLAESAMKRSGGIKDAGGVIPGHGGILDRLDGVTFAGPVLYVYLVWTTT